MKADEIFVLVLVVGSLIVVAALAAYSRRAHAARESSGTGEQPVQAPEVQAAPRNGTGRRGTPAGGRRMAR